MPDAAALRAGFGEGRRVEVRVTPNASADEVRVEDAVIIVRTTATPEGGKANEAVLRLLARALDVPQSALELVRGARAGPSWSGWHRAVELAPCGRAVMVTR